MSERVGSKRRAERLVATPAGRREEGTHEDGAALDELIALLLGQAPLDARNDAPAASLEEEQGVVGRVEDAAERGLDAIAIGGGTCTSARASTARARAGTRRPLARRCRRCAGSNSKRIGDRWSGRHADQLIGRWCDGRGGRHSEAGRMVRFACVAARVSDRSIENGTRGYEGGRRQVRIRIDAPRRVLPGLGLAGLTWMQAALGESAGPVYGRGSCRGRARVERRQKTRGGEGR